MDDSWLEMAYEDRTHQEFDPEDEAYFYGPTKDDGIEHDDCCGECEICGEPYCTNGTRLSLAEVGEFVAPENNHVIAHAECGLNAGYELA